MTSKKHDKALEDILANPHKIGIQCPVETAYLEIPIYKNMTRLSDRDHNSKGHKGRQLGQIDLLFHLQNGLYILIEYKCNDTIMQRRKAQEQLIIESKALSESRQIEVAHMAYVHGTQPYNVEELSAVNGHFQWNTLKRGGG